jgi:FkbM family methyltransferase
MTNIKHGFIITYYKSIPYCEELLERVIDTLSKENYYLVLASHSPVPQHITSKCDYYFYQKLNVVDDRKYSHGVAESNLIELSLEHLRHKGIDWSYKMSYDVDIIDVSHFNKWVKNYEYDFVSCNWGSNFICTNSFFANVNFVLDNIKFYKTIDDMFMVNTVLENCWQKDIEDKNLQKRVFSFENKSIFFGQNKIDNLFYNYNHIDFWYDENELKFFIRNNGDDLNAEVRIFDYYTDLCLYKSDSFELPKDITIWVAPPNSNNLSTCKNGFYLEIIFNDHIIRKNILIKDFDYKDDLHKKFETYKYEEVKYNEYCDFNDFNMYSSFNIDVNNIRNFVDIGSCYGFASMPFLRKNIKTYMIDADESNIRLLEENFKNNSNINILYKAISNIDGNVDFYLEGGCSVVSSLYQTNALGSETNRVKVTVPSITPNTLIEKYIEEPYIDFMKIDVEGAEYDLFESITDENLNKISRLIIEYHNNNNEQVLGVLKKLTKNDFYFEFDVFKNEDLNKHPVDRLMGVIYAHKK